MTALRCAIVVGIVLAGGQRAHAQALDLWPLVVRDARPVAGLETTRIAGPLFERWRSDGLPGAGPGAAAPPEWAAGWSLRPLVSRVEAEEASRLDLLHPLAALRVQPDRTRWRLSPLFDRTVHHEPSQRDDERWTAGPAFGGRTEAGEGYGGLFPVAGVAKQRFGFERLEFLLFPFFGRSRDHHGFVRTHVLWPFFSWGQGGGRSLLRVWPLYGQDRREGEWDRRFALWPFFHWRTERPGTAEEQRVRLFLPLYGETRTAHSRARFVLGPLYMDSVNTRNGARSVDLAFPLVRLAHRPAREDLGEASEVRIQPFFRRRLAPGYERRSALFGAWDRLRIEDHDQLMESLRLAFVTRFERLEDQVTGEERRRRDVWPLFTQRQRTWRDGKGGAHESGTLFAPWPLPVAGEAFQRNAAGLFTLYEHRHRDGESRSDWIQGLARRRVSDDYRLDAVSWLFRREREGARVRTTLFGLPVPPGDSSATGP